MLGLQFFLSPIRKEDIGGTTYYPFPLSPSPWMMMTVDLCSVMAGKMTGGGMVAKMLGSPIEEAIFLSACIYVFGGGWW